MNVYITSTPEFSQEKLSEVVTLLQGVPGEIKFFQPKPFKINQLILIDEMFENIPAISSLTFGEFFKLAEIYRDSADIIKDDDFLILITSIRNDQNWFSAFDHRNIFVQGDEWDIISNVDSKFGIAHQCVENIFESLIGVNIYNVPNEPNIHMESIGCLMDFCKNKADILKKLQSANICDSCYQRSLEMGVSQFITAHIVDIIEKIRKEFVISRRFSNSNPMEQVHVDELGRVFIANRIVKLGAIPQVVYLFFLLHLDGIPSNELCSHLDHFKAIYNTVKKNPDEYAMNKLCCKKIPYRNRVEKNKPTFETNRSRTKEAIKSVVGETLTNHYSIQLVNDHSLINKFRIPLKRDNVDINPRFLTL